MSLLLLRNAAQTLLNPPALFAYLRAPSSLFPAYNWLELLGLGVVFYLAYTFLWVSFPASKPHLEPTDWAVVTGATDGIGKEYARNFFQRGLNVMVISRTKERVDATVEEIRADAPKGGWRNRADAPQVLGVVADFSKTTIYGAVKDALKGKPVGVLVNNVGVSYPNPLFFQELEGLSPTFRQDMIATNLTSVVEMTALVLPGMLAQKRGIVLNISSMAARIPTGSPLLALYAATKAAVENLTLALAGETRGQGVVVECHAPFFVGTKLAKLRPSWPFVPEARRFVSASVASLGTAGAVTVPYAFHALQERVIRALPAWLLGWYVLREHKGLRSRAAKKAERKAAEEKKK